MRGDYKRERWLKAEGMRAKKAERRARIETMIREGATDYRIAQTLGCHNQKARDVRAEMAARGEVCVPKRMRKGPPVAAAQIAKAERLRKPQPERVEVPKQRRCLKCSGEFRSEWSGARICRPCKHSHAFRDGESPYAI